MFVPITSKKSDRPIWVRKESVQAIVGPVKKHEHISPGNSNTYWAIEVCTSDGKVHTAYFDSAEEADGAASAIRNV